MYTLNSGNESLYADTFTTPRDFYDGAFIASEWTSNLDITKNFDVGLASPLNVAFGVEAREDVYQIKQGDEYSTYKEGGQSFPGFLATDAASHSRKNYAAYIDFAAEPIENLQVDIAGRFEHYTDFGDAKIGKITARYDFSPALAIRGTISTGFRAPTLQEEYYSATNVSPTSAFVQLPPDSPAARYLGVNPLQPELSTNYSVGLVAHPLEDLSLTVDAYSIAIGHRIVGTGALYGSGGAINSPGVVEAIQAHGNVLDPTVTYTGANVFVNGLSTKTQGVDVSANYPTDFGDYGMVNWTLAANYNETQITGIIPTPSQLASATDPSVLQPLFSPSALAELTDASPKETVSLSGNWVLGKWSVNLQETIYGPSSELNSPDGGTYYRDEVGTTGITNLEVDYMFTDNLTFTLGANNLFNHEPESIGLTPSGEPDDGSHVWGAPLGISPYGIDGGYYYARVTFNF